MCEIAMLQPWRFSTQELVDAASDIYARMSHGLGIVSVVEGDTGYEYSIYRDVAPDWPDVTDFFNENRDEAGWFIIHGRLATSGERGGDGVHPLEIDCPECQDCYILHNGVYAMRGAEYEFDAMEREGHEFDTSIDTELIAHKIGKVPESVNEANELLVEHPSIKQQSGFVMFSEHNILIWAPRYDLNEYMEMYHEYRDFSRDDCEKNYKFAVLTHDPTPDPEPAGDQAEAGA